MSTPAEDLGSGSITIELDEGDVVNEAQRLGRRIERELAIAARHAGRAIQRNLRQSIRELGALQVRIEADTRPFFRDLRRIYTIDDIDVTVRPDSRGFIEALQRQLRGQSVSVRVTPDFTGFDTAIRAHPVPPVTVPVRTDDKNLAKLGKAIGALGSAAGTATKLVGMAAALTAVAAAALQATSAVIGIVGALAPLGGIVAALPAAVGGLVVAFGVLKLATNGVGDAMKAAASGDAKKLEEALKNLSPSAKEAVLAVRDLAPSFRTLQKAVQESFFSQFSDDVKGAGKAVLGLKGPLQGVATEFGKAAKEALAFVKGPEAIGPAKDLIGGVRAAVSGLSTAVQPLLKGFLDVAGAVAKAFGPKVGEAIGSLGARFGTYLSGLAASGKAVEKVSGAVQAFRELGSVLKNVGSIFGSFTKAAQAQSGGLLASLADVTGKVADFFKSAAGQQTLGNVFRTIKDLAAQIGPIFTTLLTQIGQIAPSLGPIFTTLGPAIVNVLNALGSGIKSLLPGVQTVVNGLASALSNLAQSGALSAVGEALSQGLSALAPLLPVIGQIASTLLPVLAQAFSAVATAVAPVITALSGALLPVLPILGDAFSKIVTAVTPFLTVIGQTLGQLIAAAAPLLVTLATAFGQIVTAVQPLIAQILPVLQPMLAQAVEIFKQLVAAVIPMIPATVALFEALVPLGQKIFELIQPILEFSQGVLGFVALEIVIPVIQGIVTVLTTLAGWITTVATYVSDFKTNVTNDFNSLKASVTTAVNGMVSAVVGKFNEIKNRASEIFQSVKTAISSKFDEIKSAVTQKVQSLVDAVVNYFRELPGNVRTAMGALQNALFSAGGDLIQGMINGVRAKAGALVDAAKGVVGSAISGAKSILGIKSPSRVFAEIGRFTAQGLINGLTGSVSRVEQTADRLAEAIVKAFKGKSTRTRDALIAQLRTNEKELIRLANKREALAKKIKEANDFAASVTSRTQQAFGLQEAAAAASKAVGGLTVENITESLDVAVAKIRDFNRQINSLAKKGLNKNLLEQLIGLGPEGGGELAGVLDRASRADLRELSRVQAELDKSAKQLGRDSADHLFDAGVEASKGFLAGLKGQEDEIEKLMISIAKSIQKSIKSALGIKSPSKVMARLGKFTAEGLSVGLDSEARSIRRASLNAVQAITDPFRGGERVGSATSGQAVSGAPVATTNNRTVSPTFYITEVGDAGATAQRVINRLTAAALL